MADRLVGCHSRLFLLLLILTNLCVAVQEQQQQSTFEGNTILKGDGGQAYDWDLVIVIPSHITEFSRRCAVRDGWARQLRGHEQNNRAGLRSIKLLFTVGAHYPDNSTRDTAMAEMKQFDDIITLPSDFVDRYDALGTKVRLSFREAVDRLGRFRLVLKADTDSYVHVEKLLDFFDKENMWNGDPVYAGSFRHAPVMWEPEDKDHKWFDGEFTKMTGLTQYPWNAQGGGYVISYDLAKYLAHPPLELKSWTHEDVGVGAWLMALDYRRVDMPVGFAAPECGCALDCVDPINDLGGRDLVIDHYVPPFLHRVRQRRMELFGDDCWVSSLSNTISPLAEKVIPVNNMCYSPMWLGGEDLQNDFHRVWEKPRLSRSERRRAHKENSDTPESSAESTSEEPSSRTGWSAKRKTKKPIGEQLKLNKVLDGFNLYDILKISPTATQEQIKKSYRRLILEHHPDKKKGSAEEEEEKMIFLRIQEAFEVLSDERRRKQYDSSLPFDEDVPTELEEDEDFYEVFGPVFDSNARWSNRRPVPRLGDDASDLNKVKRFYHFWMNFDSWRDFSQHDEYDVADASCREERRWVERQNQRIRRKYETAEASRVRKLVESAMQ
ncbi:hypothetical protein Pmar_PMAR002613 [Perkinsus marinus ATCC 50983]|uniref:J domain-containing protein n=1 Tax=Perkinsus marinus (strain ATCC 50983 / TXsc) TaxID=423536 RepID=C5LNR8_PERM5|nr:hypothetical protein Pmar_PMAR002613 [Perkinsus marinus ATCC 50983]EER01619.1 hypothetical protein Pmar_PMAR002613 [Perkinsus marinus ATCC 50983]|eukprot:XP_002768901.1 hypothetical protein Pmar_PMAR002613 [Perkinsus marinus ATCC 50983]